MYWHLSCKLIKQIYEYDAQRNIINKQSVIITPEPATLLLLGAGLLGLGFLVRRKIRSLN
ncbi:MAG: PEP-CTERM sorting domain-containing protein [Deltaproteobacteria bacterium]|nr:PEP-CTERM sorting domain-containing protein [Deltaproteobacteria bacterium]